MLSRLLSRNRFLPRHLSPHTPAPSAPFSTLSPSASPASTSIITRERGVCAHNYSPLPVVLSRGEGAHVWDVDGTRYLDMMSAYSAVSHGHSHPRLVAAAQAQMQRLCIVSRAFHTEPLGAFLERACGVLGFDKALPMNSGSEAVDTAIKLARKWAVERKGVRDGAQRIVACEGNFHGRTLGIVAMSGEKQYREGFGPFPPWGELVPYGDVHALEEAITEDTAAFIVEPIQGEGGIVIPPEGYLAACAEVCRRRNVLLVVDEVQTGLGRTGAVLACHHERVQPDIVVIGKALGGGIMPVSMVLASADVMGVLRPGDHGSTFGGNPLAAAVGLEALNVMMEDDYVGRSAELGKYFMERLAGLRSDFIKDLRGRGLFVGMEIDPQQATAREVCERLMRKGLLSKETHETVVRLAPPLIIEKEQLDWAVDQFRQVLADMAIEKASEAVGV